jgi:hypothetical protein
VVRYRLRTMVLARMLTEVAVLLGMVAIPVFLLAAGKLPSFRPHVQGMFITLGVIAVAILPWYGFITWLVTTNENGIATHALFKKQFCTWNQIKGLTRRASWNWLRFVVEYEGGDLTFPVLLNKCDVLVGEIRSHLQPGPGGSGVGGAGRSTERSFVYDPVAMTLQIIQSLAAVVFVAVFWLFFTSKAHHFKPGSNDAISLFIFCAVASLIFLWRLWAVVFMPKSVTVTKKELIVRTHFNERHISWPQVLAVGLPLPLLPEGFTIKTKKSTVLIGTGMESADELHEIVQFEIGAAKDPGSASAAAAALSDVDLAEIQRRVDQHAEFSQQLLKSLAENQVDLDADREIEYHFLAPTEDLAQSLAARLVEQGCQTEIFANESSPESANHNYLIRALVLQSPVQAGNENNTAFLIGLADHHSCRYDGWNTELAQAPELATEGIQPSPPGAS